MADICRTAMAAALRVSLLLLQLSAVDAQPPCPAGFNSTDATSPFCYKTIVYAGGVVWPTARDACFAAAPNYASSLAVVRDPAQRQLVLQGWCGGTATGLGPSMVSGFWLGYAQINSRVLVVEAWGRCRRGQLTSAATNGALAPALRLRLQVERAKLGQLVRAGRG